MIRDCKKLVDHLCGKIRCHADVAVVGMSGGADSSLTAILCMKALGKTNVYGISMPYDEADLKTFNSLSAGLAERIGVNHLVRPITQIADAINGQILTNPEAEPIPSPLPSPLGGEGRVRGKHKFPRAELTDLNKGNSKSRARMCVLYGITHDLSIRLPGKRVRVIGTGNLSEDFIGYDTKGGDALADVFPIGELFKSEIYQLLEYFRDDKTITEANINRIPSAGLKPHQTDEEDLGYSYNEMEKGIRFCVENYDSMSEQDLDEITTFVWQRHKAHKHKHEAPPVIKLRSFCE